ncbi:MAG: 16S rRNA (uracil(1498)-N(3))-methyltransferase [Bacteroidetes bacterium]|nr:16S rRNA (uracil(1498)-N(3))-methyltransferase [Bacteroidota bacterium]
MHLFYTPDLLPSGLPNGKKIGEVFYYTLNEEESKHCIRVLRLTIGAQVILIDGKGGWYQAIISDDNPKRCTVKITQSTSEYGKSKFDLHIAIAPTKNMDRLEWFTEKAIEVGIAQISIINCQNSERTVVKAERLNKVAIAAIKQSLKAYLPKINEVMDYKKFMASTKDFTGQKFIAHCYPPISCGEGLVERHHLKNLYQQGNDVLILIGPEGDFSVDEVKLALSNGFNEISLGISRLRTETAALYACTTINILNE